MNALEADEFSSSLREYLIDSIAVYGGHFAANLGVVELTVALHHTFQTPEDLLVWDVGHQAYAHKLLTGREDLFTSLRKFNGYSGFPKRDESKFDAFGTGHSSTSISAVLGMAEAAYLQGKSERQHIAVIGDGALTAGLAFEALNNAGVSKANLLIIVNDNSMSIDPNVGALHRHLANLRAGSSIQNFFVALGLPYYGPADGHDMETLLATLSAQKQLRGPRVLHVVTMKGKGYPPAELEQTRWHSTGGFDKISGKSEKAPIDERQGEKFQIVFGETLLELARQNQKIVGITPAMPSGSSLDIMMKEMPERCFDVGIAEQHAVTFSAGLAASGTIPFCNVYSTFLQRAYDSVIHDVVLQKLPVIFCLDRAGVVGADGPTHHGVYDLAYLNCLPGITIAAPMNEVELRNMMYSAQINPQGPWAIRYPRGEGNVPDWRKPFVKIATGKARKISEGKKVAVLSLGSIGINVEKALVKLEEEGITPAHFDFRFLKPLDTDALKEILAEYPYIITAEDGCLKGGFGSAVSTFFHEINHAVTLHCLGLPDIIVPHGSTEQLHEMAGISSARIAKVVRELWLK